MLSAFPKKRSSDHKSLSMSDTAYHSGVMRSAFPADRYGGSKGAIHAAFLFIAPKVRKVFTERRARSIWEGSARRIDAEESAVLHRAEIEEARREQTELRERLHRLDAALAALDEEEIGETLAAHSEPSRRMGGAHFAGTQGPVNNIARQYGQGE